MVHSPMYKRLMRFVEDAKANETLSDYDSKHSSTLDAIREAEERIQHFREYQGFQGQTNDASGSGGLRISQRRRSRSRCAAS